MSQCANNQGSGPKKERHHAYDESVDETAKQIESEPVEVEAEVPAEENEPVENTQEKEKPPPLFEDEE
jgi:uncharacterized protein YfcZ (UPF0381/DUF406 family)